VWVKLETNLTGTDKPVAIAFVYFPPHNSTHSIDQNYFSLLENDIASYQEQHMIYVCGDFNARTKSAPDWPINTEGSDGDLFQSISQLNFQNNVDQSGKFDNVRFSQDYLGTNEFGPELLTLCKSTGLRIMNGRIYNHQNIGKFTFIKTTGKSVVDYLLAAVLDADLITHFEVGTKMPESDHCPLLFNLKRCLDSVQHENLELTATKHTKYKWERDELAQLHNTICDDISQNYLSLFYDRVSEQKDVNIIADQFYLYFDQALRRTFRKSCGQGKRNVNRPKWFDDECLVLRNQALNSKCDTDSAVNCREYRRVKQGKKRKYTRQLVSKLDQDCGSPQFWNTFTELAPKSQKSLGDTKSIIEKLEDMHIMPHLDYFDKDFELEVEEFLNRYDNGCVPAKYPNEILNILNNNIMAEEIKHVIGQIKSGKSPGIDSIAGDFVKFTCDTIVKHLVVLFNVILEKGDYPTSWAMGLRIPIPKGVSDIRPITIEPIFGKIFQTILDRRLTFVNDALAHSDVFNGGFKKGSMTADNMLILLGCIKKQILTGKQLYVAFVDFKKAFIYVNRKILFYKLISSGLNGRTISILKSMYSKTKSAIKINGLIYKWVVDNCGTNQGGPISPSMFREMLADLKVYLNAECGIVISDTLILVHLLWADDLILVSDSAGGLQSQLDGLFKFCSKFQMIVNEMKTNVVLFGKCPKENLSFVFNGKQLVIADQYKYVGNIFKSIIMGHGDPLSLNQEYLAEQANKAMFAVLKRTNKIGRLTPKVYLQLFDSFIMPILEYGSEVWYRGVDIMQIERVQLRFLKMILGVRCNTSTLALYGDTGRFPLSLRIKVKQIKYWVRVVKMCDNTIVKQVYNMMLQLDNLNCITWCSTIRKTLYEYGFNQCWELQETMSLVNLVADFKKSVYSRYTAWWQVEINNTVKHPLLRVYRLFKSDYRMEPYLIDISDSKVRRSLSRLRLSSHNLHVETGRHCRPKTPLEQRLCLICNDGNVEDEMHFIEVCSVYNDLRSDLLNCITQGGFVPVQTTHANVNMVQILKENNVHIQFYLGKFLTKAFKRRTRILSRLTD
jgi:hypothetical protein